MSITNHQRQSVSHPADVVEPIVRHFLPPAGLREVVTAQFLRLSLHLLFKPVMRPPWPLFVQRGVLHGLSVVMPGASGVTIRHELIGRMPVERITPKGSQPRHAVLYLHGGAFCTGSPRSHRSITTRLAKLTRAEVLVPHYRRVPEHPFPAQIEDTVTAYAQLLKDGYKPEYIAIVGDSAGCTLTFMATMALRRAGLPLPAVLVMMSPAVDMSLTSRSAQERADRDPMINLSWGRQAMAWYRVQHDHPLGNPMAQDLSDLPPALIQVGDDEVLFDDAHWVAHAAGQAGRHVELEIYLKRWHVFQVHAGVLPSSTAALRRQAEFIRHHWRA